MNLTDREGRAKGIALVTAVMRVNPSISKLSTPFYVEHPIIYSTSTS
jgi:hypothetical protein